jgi:AraC family transcriptional regulator, regulatory protein of adaptative response / methylated-DNA-[protein]-cysteine methyltransferase
MIIKFSIGPSPIGKLLVAQSGKGLCAVQVRESASALERSLRERFADASVVRDEKALAPLRRMVLDAIAGRAAPDNLSLDVRGTDFQRSVWRELRRIPAGVTRSYADIAKAIGKPKATRAVANACGANNLPVVIPCHRVIAKDGSIGGYTGGLRIKRALLDAEGVELS